MILRERDHFAHTTRYQKCTKFYGEHFLFYHFLCKSGNFRVIGINVKFPLTGILEMATILKFRSTSTISNKAQSALQDVPFRMNHVTFS